MCEIHHNKCTTCKKVFTTQKKLASCDSQEPGDRCPDSLCMYVGSPRRPIKSECEACREAREDQESDESEESEDQEDQDGKESAPS
ncbi:hypothetical protein F4779DRAFT_568500 [Xylariaceae sp. FL0662B]|nr:hypothetical protein F4779DRAFT_568500 [Xylariaceae sp. FL0662B]